MFNTTNNNSRVSFNSPATGIIQKSNEKSFFLRMHQNSNLADKVFGSNGEYKNEPVIVLQVLLTHEEWYLVEVVKEKDLLSDEDTTTSNNKYTVHPSDSPKS